MYSFTDSMRAAFKAIEQYDLTRDAQLVLLHLLNKDNCLGRSGFLQVSDGELRARAGLSSKGAVTEAKRRLKNLGLIDFVTEPDKPKKGTRYELLICTRLLPQLLGQKAGQKMGQNSRISTASSLISKKKEREEETCAPAKGVVAEWAKSPIFAPLDEEMKAELNGLATEHGEETIRRAMRAAKFANGSKSINFNYFLYKLRELLKGETVKPFVDQSSFKQSSYEEPIFDDTDAPWAKYIGGESNQAAEEVQPYVIYEVKGEIADGENAEPTFDDRDAPWARYIGGGLGEVEGGRESSLRETASEVRGAIQAEGLKRFGNTGDRTGGVGQSGMYKVQRADLPQNGRDASFETRYRHGGRAIEYHVCHLPS